MPAPLGLETTRFCGMEDLQTTKEFVDALNILAAIALTLRPFTNHLLILFNFPGSPFVFKRHEFSGSQVWVGPLYGYLFELDIAFTTPEL